MKNNYSKIILDVYQNLLGRKPDESGFKHYLNLLERNEINKGKLEEQIKNSMEYKMIRPIEVDKNISYLEQMRKEWDSRRDFGFPEIQNDEQKCKKYFEHGYSVADILLGKNTTLYENMFGGKQLNQMKVLDIGAGVGRILNPMSELFSQAIGVEISPKMINLSKSYIKKNNCKIILNDGNDLSIFEDNYFDFCYSVLVFQHFPNKIIAQNYMKEISRVLKPSRFLRILNDDTMPDQYIKNNTWCGIKYSKEDIEEFCNNSEFRLFKEEGKGTSNYILTFKSEKKP